MLPKIKIIFLDIDGVMNSQRFYTNSIKGNRRDEYGDLFDPLSASLLNKLIKETGAKIVISSTWRHAGLKKMQSMWIDRKMEGEVIAITPDFRGSLTDDGQSKRFGEHMNRLINNKSNDHGVSIPRGCEIEWYYEFKHNFKHWQWEGDYVREFKSRCTLDTYVILDDDSDMLYSQRNNFVHCSNLEGFTQPEYEQAYKILMHETV
jgi:HAD domain in Swiss Army Knife RNA repair proteins